MRRPTEPWDPYTIGWTFSGLSILFAESYDRPWYGLQPESDEMASLRSSYSGAVGADEWAEFKRGWFARQNARLEDGPRSVAPQVHA